MHYKRNNNESTTYVQGLRPFGNTLPKGVKGILKRNGYNYSEIISKWSFLVGKDIANCSFPKSIKMKKGNMDGTLVLTIKRGDEINIEYSKKDIINKINSYFGYKLIGEIKLKAHNFEANTIKNKNTSNKLLKKFDKKINEIKNNSIRNSLFQLLKNIKND